MARRKRPSRGAKLVVVLLVAVALGAIGWTVASRYSGKSSPSTQSLSVPSTAEIDPGTPLPSTTSLAAQARRQIGAIVYLGANGLPPGTLESLRALHATEVYLYVAYYSDAYYLIPQNPYGLAQPRDTLGAAITQLHGAGYRVIGVISSALLDWRQAPPVGIAILQSPRVPIFDPVKAGPFVEELTKALVRYHVDGVYVGEPYWVQPTSDSEKKLQFNRLYERLIAITGAAGVPFQMIMPTYYAYFDDTEQAGLLPSFLELPFQSVGMDAEVAYYTNDRNADLAYYKRLVALTLSMANGRDSLIELSLHKAMVTGPVPLDFFEQELSLAKSAGIKTVVIFAAEFWANLPNRAGYSSALADFLAR